MSPSSKSEAPTATTEGPIEPFILLVLVSDLLRGISSSSRIAERGGSHFDNIGGFGAMSCRDESSSVEEPEEGRSVWLVVEGVVEGVESAVRLRTGEEASMSMAGTGKGSPPGMGRFSMRASINSFSFVLFSSKLAGSDDVDLNILFISER